MPPEPVTTKKPATLDKKKDAKKKKDKPKKAAKKKRVKDLTPKEVEKIKVVHTETIAALSSCSEISEEDKKVVQ